MRSDRYKHEQTAEKPRKNRKALKILILMIFLLAAANAAALLYSYKTTLDSLDLKFTDDAPEIEFASVCKASDYVKSSVGNVSPGAEYLDTDTLGSKTLVYTVTEPVFGGLLNPSREFTLTYNIVDTTEPLILWNGTGSVLEKGAEFNIADYLAYGDNADPRPALEVDGKVKTNKEGTYKLHATVTDASGNSTKCDMEFEVVETLPEYVDETESTGFRKFAKENAGEGRSFGIDVSEWQHDIDFKLVKSAGCEFVIIRIGYSDNGVVTEDSKFEENIRNAKAAGLKVGVYLYSYDNTDAEVRSSAEWVVQKLGGTALDLPVVFDWEDFVHFPEYEMNFADVNRLYDSFSSVITDGGYESMLYGSKLYLENVWQDTDTRPVWLAHYTGKTDYSGPYRIWQASCIGKIKGIKGNVDLDIMYE